MRRSLGFQQQCYGNGKGYGHGHGYDGMWAKSQDQMQHYEVHEESWESHHSGMNMKSGGGGWHEQVDYSEYSDDGRIQVSSTSTAMAIVETSIPTSIPIPIPVPVATLNMCLKMNLSLKATAVKHMVILELQQG
ncbi:hypothetical protein L6164_012419 [Bauhinia variegata]|uniref:Uncharacterized protein n=1 Tax=Bauhinia variegata TaxID=167791 RepID=A0ACB9P909_BAUVA|nr:hypothetical protein L6164_012419 [Bauhinia variegata]